MNTPNIENTPNTLDNRLDQAPKVWLNYEESLYSPEIAEQIKMAFDDFDVISCDDEVEDFVSANYEHFPMKMIVENLEQNNLASLEINRRQKEETSWWTPAVWAPQDVSLLGLGKTFSQTSEPIKDGDIVTYLIFKKIWNNPHDMNVSGKVIEYPSKNVLISGGLVFTRDIKKEDLENISL